MVNVIWHGAQLKLLVNAGAVQALKESCKAVEDTARESIGTVPPPSPPGHAPAAPTGTLKGRVTTEIDPSALTGKVGLKLEYALRMELGFVGKDKLGRKYNQAPRPYLRPALEKNIGTIKKLFGAK